ncbi:MAG: xanthine dehydrogenase family protein subunit M [Rhodospirillales bacterium]|nr:xanthine dehydrogenase family protein subunit M [Rhodospirillales bacterium]
MKPPPFAYAKPANLAEALALKSEHGDDGAFLAGGQSLIATLNMRLSAPEILIDVNGIAELSGIEKQGNILRIGAMTRHRDIENSAEIAAHAPLIAAAITQVGHPAIRNRGTIGGSIAFADPAAEMPACLLALDGVIEIAGADGRRKVAAGDFFKGIYETDLGAGDILTAMEIPVQSDGWRNGFDEIGRRHGDYAMAGLAARLRIDGGKIAEARLVYFAVGGTPVLAVAAGEKLIGNGLTPDAIEAAAKALDSDLDPFDDLHCSAAMKRHLAGVLTSRVLGAMGDVENG